MDRNGIVIELYNTHFVENFAFKYMGRADRLNMEDIVQELYLTICEADHNKLCKAYLVGGINAVRRYVSGLIVRQMRSTNSRIYRKYTRRVYTELPAGSMNAFQHINSDAQLWTATAVAAKQ